MLCFFWIYVLFGVLVVYFGVDLVGEIGCVEQCYVVDIVLIVEQVFLEVIYIVVKGGDDIEIGDYDMFGGRQVGFYEGCKIDRC